MGGISAVFVKHNKHLRAVFWHFDILLPFGADG